MDFGVGGKALLPLFGYERLDASGIACDPNDGSIVVVASCLRDSTSRFETGVVRLRADGAIDTGFGEGGLSALVDPGGRDDVIPIRPFVLASGMILVHCRTGDFPSLALLRIDGSLATGFGVEGVAIVDMPDFHSFKASVTLLPDGKILLVGHRERENESHGVVVRLLANGQRDPALGIDGILALDDSVAYGRDDGIEHGVSLGDRFIVAGKFNDALIVSRYSTQGIVDQAFGDGGRFTMVIDGPSGTPKGTLSDLVLADGGLIAVGTIDEGHASRGFLAAIDSTGHLDPAFNAGELFYTPDAVGSFRLATGASDAIGRFIVAGARPFGAASAAILLGRCLASGVLDPAFGEGGFVTSDDPSGVDFLAGLAIQDGQGILVSAQILDAPKPNSMVLRFLNTASDVLENGSAGSCDRIRLAHARRR